MQLNYFKFHSFLATVFFRPFRFCIDEAPGGRPIKRGRGESLDILSMFIINVILLYESEISVTLHCIKHTTIDVQDTYICDSVFSNWLSIIFYDKRAFRPRGFHPLGRNPRALIPRDINPRGIDPTGYWFLGALFPMRYWSLGGFILGRFILGWNLLGWISLGWNLLGINAPWNQCPVGSMP